MSTRYLLAALVLVGCAREVGVAGPGERCVRSTECQPGLACVAGACSGDTSGLEGGTLPPARVDAGPPPDGGPPPDDGGPPMDAGPPPVDAGPPPVDSGPLPLDGGPPPLDAGPPPVDAGPPPVDSGPAEDGGLEG